MLTFSRKLMKNDSNKDAETLHTSHAYARDLASLSAHYHRYGFIGLRAENTGGKFYMNADNLKTALAVHKFRILPKAEN